MMDIEEYMEEVRREEQESYDKFMGTCASKITSGELIYNCLALYIAKHFKVEIPTYGDIDGGVYHILNHYIEEVDEDFEKWIHSDDGPFIRPIRDLRRIFYEFDSIEDDKKLMDAVNEIYGLELHMDEDKEYIYALSLDFNSFEPINVDGVHEIKRDIEILKKYGHPTDELEAKLAEYGLDPEIMEVL